MCYVCLQQGKQAAAEEILPEVLPQEQGHCRNILVKSLCWARDIIYLVYFQLATPDRLDAVLCSIQAVGYPNHATVLSVQLLV